LTGAVTSGAVSAAPLSEAGTSTFAEIAQGKLRGYRNQGIHVFKDIPYGKPPTASSRFQPPQPAGPWAGVRDATKYGPSSIQQATPVTISFPGDPPVPALGPLLGWGDDSNQSENCLVLNVWTPSLDHGRRPVMFRIHGGGFAIGSGSWPQSDGTNQALRNDVVVVTVNHRLGPLGYLYLAELGGEKYADSGNAGMLDLVLALKWVRDNIACFGGDPGNVMIFGESGGGYKVSYLLAMPAAQGLFQRAVIESGPGLDLPTPAAATAAAQAFLKSVGVSPDNLGALDSLPAAKFAASTVSATAPVLDGRSFPVQPADALLAGASSDVPLLIGSNQTETTLLDHLVELAVVNALDWAGVRARLLPSLAGNTDRVIATYRRNFPKASPPDVLLYIEADQLMREDSIRLAERKFAGSSAPVYMYLFTWRTDAIDGLLKACHGLEVPFEMDNPQTATAVSGTPGGAALSARISDAWAAFARCGNPNVRSLPHWPRYTLGRRETMLFNNHSTVVSDPFGERTLWNEILPQPA
jgi:para-nitrobenzyl esterase